MDKKEKKIQREQSTFVKTVNDILVFCDDDSIRRIDNLIWIQKVKRKIISCDDSCDMPAELVQP